MDDPLHNQPHACPLLWRPSVRDQPSGPCLPALRRQRQVHLQDRVEREGASDAVAGTFPLSCGRLNGLTDRTIAGRRLPEKCLPQHERCDQRGQVRSPGLILPSPSLLLYTLLNACPSVPADAPYTLSSFDSDPEPFICYTPVPHDSFVLHWDTCMYEREHRNSSANVMPSCRPIMPSSITHISASHRRERRSKTRNTGIEKSKWHCCREGRTRTKGGRGHG